MKHLSLTCTLILALAAVLLASPAWSASHSTSTPFIEGDVDLTPDPDRKGAYQYLKPGLDLSQYDRLIIDAVEIWIHPESKYKGINPDDLKTLADAFRQILIDELEPAYPVVDKAGPKTLHLRLAITGVKLQKKKRGLFGYLPIGFVVSAATSTAAKRTSLTEGGIEAELLDAKTSERLGVLVDSGIGGGADKITWPDIEMSLRFYAQRFRGRLDKAHGVGQ